MLRQWASELDLSLKPGYPNAWPNHSHQERTKDLKKKTTRNWGKTYCKTNLCPYLPQKPLHLQLWTCIATGWAPAHILEKAEVNCPSPLLPPSEAGTRSRPCQSTECAWKGPSGVSLLKAFCTLILRPALSFCGQVFLSIFPVFSAPFTPVKYSSIIKQK